jgi:hypothetical protein
MTAHSVGPTLRRAGLALAIAAGGFAAQPAAAQGEAPIPAFTTADLARACGPAAGDANAMASRSVCYAVPVAVGQAHAIFSSGRGAARPVFCLPDPSPSMEAVSAAFVSWAAAHQRYAGARAAEGVLRFAAATYPCPPAAQARRR